MTIKTVTVYMNFIFFIKGLKSKKKKLALTYVFVYLCSIMSFEKYSWAIQKSLFAQTNQDSTFSHTHENSKLLHLTLKYFSFFNNKRPAS